MYNGEGFYTAEISGGDKGYYTTKEDGNTYKGVPFYRSVINSLAKAVHDKFNDVYKGVTNDKGESFKLFEFADGGASIDYAKNIKTAEAWKDNPIRSVHPEWSKDKVFDGSDPSSSDYDELSNQWINKILSVFEAKHDIGEESLKYKFEDYVSHYGNTIGSQLEGTNKLLESNTILLNSVDDARDAVMKVSTDEEGINMLTYQKWYNAMARMVTTLDSALDKLINNTGVVGL
jgi:flagellar hook-associated protein 1 FlgK